MAKKVGANSSKIDSRRKSLASKNSKPKDSEADLQHLEKILELMEKHEVTELEWEKKGERLKLRTHLAPSEMMPISAGNYFPKEYAAQRPQVLEKPSHVDDSASKTGSPQSSLPANQKQVLSPFVGTFYRAPSPETDSYVREGQVVKRGDVLCIIEAMKLMNEIEAEFPGKIVSVLVENGQPVEFGEPLFIVEP